jgi:hypothetical protein
VEKLMRTLLLIDKCFKLTKLLLFPGSLGMRTSPLCWVGLSELRQVLSDFLAIIGLFILFVVFGIVAFSFMTANIGPGDNIAYKLGAAHSKKTQ